MKICFTGERSKRLKISKLACVNHHEALALTSVKSFKGNQSFEVKKDIVACKPVRMTVEEALSLKMQCDLSDDQYQMIRNASLVQNADIYPTLKEIFREKNKCYPDGTIISETSAVCSLQNMFNHTLSRILDLPDCKVHLRKCLNKMKI